MPMFGFYKAHFKGGRIKEEIQEDAIVNNHIFKILFDKT